MKQLIEQQRQEFEDLFCDREMVVKDGITQIKYKPTQDAIFDWHKQSLRQFIDGLIEREEGKYIRGSHTTVEDDEFNRAKFDTISHLKELKEELN